MFQSFLHLDKKKMSRERSVYEPLAVIPPLFHRLYEHV